MSKVGAYLRWLAPSFLIHLKETGALVYVLLQIVGEELDLLKTAIVGMRRQSRIATSEAPWTDRHGRERDLERIPGETDEQYIARLVAAFKVKQRGGTIPGMVEACALLGLEVEVYELFRTDPSHWAEFELRILGGDLTLLNQSIFYQTILALKPAHTKPVFTVQIAPDEYDDPENFDDGNYFDTWVDY